MVLTREDKQSGRALSMLGFGCMRFPSREVDGKKLFAALDEDDASSAA